MLLLEKNHSSCIKASDAFWTVLLTKWQEIGAILNSGPDIITPSIGVQFTSHIQLVITNNLVLIGYISRNDIWLH